MPYADSIRRKEMSVAATRAWQEKRRLYLAQIKMGFGCADCGYREHPEALDFDHLPGCEKLFQISYGNVAWGRLLAEMEKCEVVCANCHRIRSASRRRGR